MLADRDCTHQRSEVQVVRQTVIDNRNIFGIDQFVQLVERGEDVRVLQQDGTPMLFTTRGHTLRFFSGTPGTVRVLAADRETVYSLTLPELWDSKWEVPAAAKHGVPPLLEAVAVSRDLWQLLAILGGLGLLVEWLLFGRVEGRIRRIKARVTTARAMKKAS